MSNFVRDMPIAECILDWELPETAIDRCDAYYLLHWSTEYFHHKNSCGILAHKGNKYAIHYNHCQPGDLFKYREVILSFRKLPHFMLGWVLVRPKYGTEIV